MVGRRSWHLAVLDFRFVAVEPVLYIVAHLRSGQTERDAVYILYHDGSETEELADDVSVFVARVRKAARGHS
jgi:hypothetical protein